MTLPFENVFAMVAAFAIAFFIGWMNYRNFFWNYVDLIYYPLAAIGVFLLFVSSDVQRELLEITKSHEKEILALEELKAKRPSVVVGGSAKRLDGNVEHIALIEKWVEICTGSPVGVSARCLAVKNLGLPVSKFLKVARRPVPIYEERLLSTCIAGEELLADVHTSQALSTLVTEKLLAQYVQAVNLEISALQYEEFARQVQEFKIKTEEYSRQIHRIAFNPEDNSSHFLLEIRMAEIEFGEILFQGLSQCVSAPKDALVQLKNWTSETSTKKDEVTRLGTKRQELKQVTTRHPLLLWIQLNLWPIFLILALSLKFAKGAASFRKAKISTT